MVNTELNSQGFFRDHLTMFFIVSLVVVAFLIVLVFFILWFPQVEKNTETTSTTLVEVDNGQNAYEEVSSNNFGSNTAFVSYVPEDCSGSEDLCSCLNEHSGFNASYDLNLNEISFFNTGEIPIKDMIITFQNATGDIYTFSELRSRLSGWPERGLRAHEPVTIDASYAINMLGGSRIVNMSFIPIFLVNESLVELSLLRCDDVANFNSVIVSLEEWPECSSVKDKKNCIEYFFPENCRNTSVISYTDYKNTNPSADVNAYTEYCRTHPCVTSPCDCLGELYDFEFNYTFSSSASKSKRAELNIVNTGNLPLSGFKTEIEFEDGTSMVSTRFNSFVSSSAYNWLLYPGESVKVFLDSVSISENGVKVYDSEQFDVSSVVKITLAPYLASSVKYDKSGTKRISSGINCENIHPEKIKEYLA